jgi:hypothetical protein
LLNYVANLVNICDKKGIVFYFSGLLYGLDNIPLHWRKQLAKEKEIMELGERLGIAIEK